ncbi:hypothetical protein M3Y94_01094800 [Aphelenchoides besseyi]|nr:hypothetical protein M3Y94_01094800 [Aphelenchoides besseyi]KAI6221671.1 hypothetical protein M3Y95_00986900 [Aphelenchoides besseyi]
MIFRFPSPQHCSLVDPNNIEVLIVACVLMLFTFIGTIVYALLAMRVYELPFPFRPYVSKLERAYRRRYTSMSNGEEALIGLNPDLDLIAETLIRRRKVKPIKPPVSMLANSNAVTPMAASNPASQLLALPPPVTPIQQQAQGTTAGG